MEDWLKIVLFLSAMYFTTMLVRALETKIEVDCRSDHENIVVVIRTDLPFFGTAYVTRSHKDQRCSVYGNGNTTLYIKIPFKGCNTTQGEDGLFMNRIRVQQHELIVSAGDREYDVGCQMFHGDLRIGTDHDMEIEEFSRTNTSSVTTDSSAAPEVLLRIYDFENDAFVNTVGLGQIVELEITIKNGKLHQGRVSDCDAYGADGKAFAIIRNFCPVDLSISDKVYVDDQSRTTGYYYLYVPFRVFRFLDGSRVSFSCNVIICQDNCPSADCGEFMGMSYGRKKRAVADTSGYQVMSVSSDVTVLDDVTSHIVGAKTNSKEKLEDSKTGTPALSVHFIWLLGGVAIAITLFFSLALNVYFMFIARRNSPVKTNENGKPGCCSSLEMHKTEINYPPRRTQRPLFD